MPNAQNQNENQKQNPSQIDHQSMKNNFGSDKAPSPRKEEKFPSRDVDKKLSFSPSNPSKEDSDEGEEIETDQEGLETASNDDSDEEMENDSSRAQTQRKNQSNQNLPGQRNKEQNSSSTTRR